MQHKRRHHQTFHTSTHCVVSSSARHLRGSFATSHTHTHSFQSGEEWSLLCRLGLSFSIHAGSVQKETIPTQLIMCTIIQHRYKNLHKSGRSILLCCWTTTLEQPTSPTTWFLTYPTGKTRSAEDASV